MDLSNLSIEELQALQLQIEEEIESREDSVEELEELDDAQDYDSLTDKEKTDFDKEFYKQYPSVLGVDFIEKVIAGINS